MAHQARGDLQKLACSGLERVVGAVDGVQCAMQVEVVDDDWLQALIEEVGALTLLAAHRTQHESQPRVEQ